MNPYQLHNPEQFLSPGLIIFRELLLQNLDKMIAIAGSPQRLRPHCKTHKMSKVIELQLERGISHHKAATIAEAEMLADAGAKDIFLAYNIVGPNIARIVQYRKRFPQVQLAVTVDHPKPLTELGRALAAEGLTLPVFLDIDPGLHRTGVPPGPAAAKLYAQIKETPGLEQAGLHLYDGHQHQHSFEERKAAVLKEWNHISGFCEELEAEGHTIPTIVAGGTPTFPVYAELDDPRLQLSPGTCLLQDVGYGNSFPDLQFTPAALLITRVISIPTQNHLTLDLGNKAVASDPQPGQRLFFPLLPLAKEVKHNEEHLILETADTTQFEPGDVLLAIPTHVCPTPALYPAVPIVEGGNIVDTWAVTARNRRLTI